MTLCEITSKTEQLPSEVVELLEKPNLAVAVIDMQTGMNPTNEDWSDLIASQLQVLAYCRMHHIPVTMVKRTILSDGEIYPELLAAKEDLNLTTLIPKPPFSAFDNPAMEKYLNQYHVKTLFLTGVYALACVHKTATDWLNLDPEKHLVSAWGRAIMVDKNVPRTPETHSMSVTIYQNSGGFTY